MAVAGPWMLSMIQTVTALATKPDCLFRRRLCRVAVPPVTVLVPVRASRCRRRRARAGPLGTARADAPVTVPCSARACSWIVLHCPLVRCRRRSPCRSVAVPVPPVPSLPVVPVPLVVPVPPYRPAPCPLVRRGSPACSRCLCPGTGCS